MKVLFVSVEIAPFAKTGGMSDVCRYLPRALRKKDMEIRLITPKFKSPGTQKPGMLGSYNITHGIKSGGLYRYNLYSAEHEQIQTYFIENEHYFNRDNIYGYSDEAERFFFFSLAVLDALAQTGYLPDIIHINDWHAAVIPFLLKELRAVPLFYKNVKTVFTIHNFGFQGAYDKKAMEQVFELFDCQELFLHRFFNNEETFSFMKAGLIYSDVINTVSPTYSKEIAPEVRRLSGRCDVYGILNGIELDEYDPAADKKIWIRYSGSNIRLKSQNKLLLQQALGLKVSGTLPVIAMISRLSTDKGFDLVLDNIDKISCLDIQFIIMGDGDKTIMQELKKKAGKYPEKLVYGAYKENLARKIYAGADILLMPSHYEPCGTTQVIAQRYGTIPIVRETGGLLDTVSPYGKFGSEATGFSFRDASGDSLLQALTDALHVLKRTDLWEKLMLNAIEYNYSWDMAAQKYFELYRTLI